MLNNAVAVWGIGAHGICLQMVCVRLVSRAGSGSEATKQVIKNEFPVLSDLPQNFNAHLFTHHTANQSATGHANVQTGAPVERSGDQGSPRCSAVDWCSGVAFQHRLVFVNSNSRAPKARA